MTSPLTSGTKPIAVTGVQPSGLLHIGNYLGFLMPSISMLSGYRLMLIIADLHALTTYDGTENIEENSLVTAATCIACGINLTDTAIFIQSRIPLHAELSWILGCTAQFGHLARMTQFKDKSQNHNINLGLFTYPVLMAADILLYKATHVPIGDDQKQHLEFTRDLAMTFNTKYNTNVFTPPQPMILSKASRVMSLQDGLKKMSKTDPSILSRIGMLDDDDSIIRKIQRAKTDSYPSLSENLPGRPEIKNLLTIFSALSNQSGEKIISEYDMRGFAVFKRSLADLLISVLSPIRKKTAQLLENKEELLKILNTGQNHAYAIARNTMEEVRRALTI